MIIVLLIVIGVLSIAFSYLEKRLIEIKLEVDKIVTDIKQIDSAIDQLDNVTTNRFEDLYQEVKAKKK